MEVAVVVGGFAELPVDLANVQVLADRIAVTVVVVVVVGAAFVAGGADVVEVEFVVHIAAGID